MLIIIPLGKIQVYNFKDSKKLKNGEIALINALDKL